MASGATVIGVTAFGYTPLLQLNYRKDLGIDRDGDLEFMTAFSEDGRTPPSGSVVGNKLREMMTRRDFDPQAYALVAFIKRLFANENEKAYESYKRLLCTLTPNILNVKDVRVTDKTWVGKQDERDFSPGFEIELVMQDDSVHRMGKSGAGASRANARIYGPPMIGKGDLGFRFSTNNSFNSSANALTRNPFFCAEYFYDDEKTGATTTEVRGRKIHNKPYCVDRAAAEFAMTADKIVRAVAQRLAENAVSAALEGYVIDSQRKGKPWILHNARDAVLNFLEDKPSARPLATDTSEEQQAKYGELIAKAKAAMLHNTKPTFGNDHIPNVPKETGRAYREIFHVPFEYEPTESGKKALEKPGSQNPCVRSIHFSRLTNDTLEPGLIYKAQEEKQRGVKWGDLSEVERKAYTDRYKNLPSMTRDLIKTRTESMRIPWDALVDPEFVRAKVAELFGKRATDFPEDFFQRARLAPKGRNTFVIEGVPISPAAASVLFSQDCVAIPIFDIEERPHGKTKVIQKMDVVLCGLMFVCSSMEFGVSTSRHTRARPLGEAPAEADQYMLEFLAEQPKLLEGLSNDEELSRALDEHERQKKICAPGASADGEQAQKTVADGTKAGDTKADDAKAGDTEAGDTKADDTKADDTNGSIIRKRKAAADADPSAKRGAPSPAADAPPPATTEDDGDAAMGGAASDDDGDAGSGADAASDAGDA